MTIREISPKKGSKSMLRGDEVFSARAHTQSRTKNRVSTQSDIINDARCTPITLSVPYSASRPLRNLSRFIAMHFYRVTSSEGYSSMSL